MNQTLGSGVWLTGTEMDILAASLPGSALNRDASSVYGADSRSNRAVHLDAEFEQRLADCPTLAYRVALGVLRNAAEAEDVAQEAMLRAYRNFHRLRDRERFRVWLVRATFRLALDRIRAKTRRERHEFDATRAMVHAQPEASVETLVASREFERQIA